MTNLSEKIIGNNVPAGMFEGIEAFWYENEKWLIYGSKVIKFTQAPVKIQNMIAEAFLKDKRSIKLIKSIGIKGFKDGFDKWYHCVLGGLDSESDFKNGKLIPDYYNNMCKESNCPIRGKLCSRRSGLKDFEVDTIRVMAKGNTINEAAPLLFVSTAGLRNRLEKLKEKLDVSNMASLMSKAGRLGI